MAATPLDSEPAAARNRPPLDPATVAGRSAAGAWVVVAVVLAVRAATVAWQPVHDLAFTELAVADVGTGSWPLLGAYSRFGWSHPGPALFEVLAVPYRLALGRPQGLLVGAVLITAGSVIGTVLLARRRGGALLAVVAAGALVALGRALGADLLLSPWNPAVIVLPLVLLGVLGADALRGDVRAGVGTVLLGSVLVQAHVGTAPVVVLVTGVGVGGGAVRRWRAARSGGGALLDRGARWWLIAGAAALVLLWLPPLIDQLAGTGNLGMLARYVVRGGPEDPSGQAPLGYAAAELAPNGAWLTGSEEVVPFVGSVAGRSAAWLLLPALGLLAAGVTAWRRRDAAVGELVAVASAAGLGVVAAAFGLAGSVYDYLLWWAWGIAALVWATVVWGLAVAVIERWSPPSTLRRWATVGAAVVLGLAAVPAAFRAAVAEPPEAARSAVVDELVAGARPALAGQGTVIVRPAEDDENAFPVPSGRQLAAGVVAAGVRDGLDLRVVTGDWSAGPGADGSVLFGDDRAVSEPGPSDTVVLVASGDGVDAVLGREDLEVLALVQDDGALAERRALEAGLRTELEAAGRPDLADQVGTPQLGWSILDTGPIFDQVADRVVRLAELREVPRAVVARLG